MVMNQRTGVDAAFEQLFNQYRQRIFNYVYRLVGEGNVAEDLTQQAFVNAYKALPGLPREANLRAWMYRIATNVAYDHLRRRRLLQWLPLLGHDRPTEADASPEHQAGQHDDVQRALAQLAPSLRSVLILYSVEGYSTAEIGKMLGISTGAVKTRLCRARDGFRAAYGEEH